MLVAFGIKTVLQKRATGDSGFRGATGRPGSLEWIAGRLFVVALLAGLLAPVLALADLVGPVAALDAAIAHSVGVACFLIGFALAVVSQVQMGVSWRIGVEEGEVTDLVDGGLFGVVRNPFFSATLLVTVGLVLMVPSVVAFAALMALLAAVELQVRLVEEPYLLRTIGATYSDYAGRVGRFVPGVGRLRTR